jgi:hypothetical protein
MSFEKHFDVVGSVGFPNRWFCLEFVAERVIPITIKLITDSEVFRSNLYI